MRVALIGRTSILLNVGRRLVERGHEIPLVWTVSDVSLGAGADDYEHFAQSAGAAFYCDTRLNQKLPSALAERPCDIAVSVNWISLIGEEILGLFRFGVLNAHAGDLPRYRGNACPNWAILAGESKVGLCVHEMAPSLDAGPVMCRDHYPLSDTTYIGDIYAWLEQRVPAMFVEAVEGLASGAIVPQPQPDDTSLHLRCYPRRPEDSRIVWAEPAEMILRLVRASSRPFDGAFGFLEGQRKVTIWRAEHEIARGSFLAVPGQVCYRSGDDPVIACTDGLIRLTEVEVEGCAGSAAGKALIHDSLRNRLT